MAFITANASGVLNLAPNQTLASGAIDRQSSQLVSEVHGKYFAAARSGRVYMATTVIAGVVLPVAAATLNSKFTLHNPAGSNIIIEPISFIYGIDTATQVVNGVGFAIQRNLSTTSGPPTTTTSAAVGPLGGSGSLPSGGAVYTQATLTNVAIPGVSAATAVPIPFYNMFSMGATTAPGVFSCEHTFDGRIILSPDDLMAGCTTVAASSAGFCGIIWAEWPA